ncbi:MAG: glycolate oxidase subunit GlcF [Pseudomonadota bacterium]|nr:glycolate oxidase subunit GlcF [Pseudomonadota bacterium]
MQTALADFIRDTPEGREADAILRSCVHCGFCLATCPTYQLLGDELDGPRGRIYLMKQVLEGAKATRTTQLHLDRCLTCRSCETTCPSGVKYGRLLDIGRSVVEREVGRTATERATRWVLRRSLLTKPLVGSAVALGRAFRGVLPQGVQAKLPRALPAGLWPAPRHARKMIALDSCVQPSLAPNIDSAMARVLDRIGISLLRVPAGGCCGALPYHIDAEGEARGLMRRNIDAWWPHVERGVEAIVVTSSGCGVMVKDYGYVLERDPVYAEKAKHIAALARDPVEVIAQEWATIAPRVAMDHGAQRVAFHPPCTLQHGMRLAGHVEDILLALGLELTPVTDKHLCCGSAGTYSILQPELANALKANKLAALEAGKPELIATANIGCMTHLASGTALRVRHWVEILDARMVDGPAAR